METEAGNVTVEKRAAEPLPGGRTRQEVVIDGTIPGTLLRPASDGPHPAILYCHAHGNAWHIGRREVLEGRPAFQAGAYGPALVAAGYVVLCLDMPGHGDRQAEGSEPALAKAALWRGETLMGQMLDDLRRGVTMLAHDAAVDATRIGALGLSMGATHAYWLAALDDRVAAVAHLCAFANMGPLIATGAHDLHGIYMTVPGLLAAGEMSEVAAMITPRPQFIGYGGRDPLTPPGALNPALDQVRSAYRHHSAADALQFFGCAESGHIEPIGMRKAVLRFLKTAFGPAERGPDATKGDHAPPTA